MIKKHKYSAEAFLFSFMLGLCSIGYFILKEKGLFTLVADFNSQQIPFTMLTADSLKDGNAGWNWYVDLGTNFVGAFSFYNLGSPFFWITLLFPSDLFPYLVGWIYILKYAFAGLTSFLYIRRFTEDERYAVLASALYSFSGFQSANLLFYHFHDVAVFFPLLLLGLEKLLVEKKKSVFAFAVFINALLNYFFFVGEVIFVVIYFLIRFFIKSRSRWKDSLMCLAEGLLGTLMASVLLLPSVAFVTSNPRVDAHISGLSALAFNPTKYLQIFRALFFPAENMGDGSCLFREEYSSCAAYLPMVGMILVIAFLLTKPWNWLSAMLVVSFVISLVPVLSSTFYMFNSVVYQRWYYMPVLLMAAASAKVLEDRKNYRIKQGVLISLCACLILTAGIWSAGRLAGIELVFRPALFLLVSGISFLGILLTYLIAVKIRNEKRFRQAAFIGISVFCVGTTALTCVLYRKGAWITSQQYYQTLKSVENIESPDEQYRFLTDDNIVTMTVPLQGIGSWCSTVGRGIFELNEALGLERQVSYVPGPDGMTELLAGKFRIADIEQEEGTLVQTVESNGYVKYIYEEEDVLPIGYTYDTYMVKSEFMKLDPELRALAMIKTLVVEDDKEETVRGVLRKYDPETDLPISAEYKEEDIRAHLEETGGNFVKTTEGFSEFIRVDSDKYAFFSVPADDGWSASVNGESVEILDINGLMAIPVYEGENEIEFTYEVPLLREGTAVSAAAVIVWMIYFAVSAAGMKKRRRENQ